MSPGAGSTPVMLAAIQNVAEVAKELLIFCPDLRILDKQGRLPLLCLIYFFVKLGCI